MVGFFVDFVSNDHGSAESPTKIEEVQRERNAQLEGYPAGAKVPVVEGQRGYSGIPE